MITVALLIAGAIASIFVTLIIGAIRMAGAMSDEASKGRRR